MTVDAEMAAKIRAKFPGIDVQAACDKAAPEVARMSWPTRDDAAAAIGKWARIELQNGSRHQRDAGNVVTFHRPTDTSGRPLLTMDEVLARIAAEDMAHAAG